VTSIALASPTNPASAVALSRLAQVLRRATAWRRFCNYPAVRRARREAVFVWCAALLRHTSIVV